MSFYPVYELQVSEVDGWVKVDGTEASNRPHHYDTLRKTFDSLVRTAKPLAVHFVKEFGYRITSDGRVVDIWMAHED